MILRYPSFLEAQIVAAPLPPPLYKGARGARAALGRGRGLPLPGGAGVRGERTLAAGGEHGPGCGAGVEARRGRRPRDEPKPRPSHGARRDTGRGERCAPGGREALRAPPAGSPSSAYERPNYKVPTGGGGASTQATTQRRLLPTNTQESQAIPALLRGGGARCGGVAILVSDRAAVARGRAEA